MTSSNTTRPQAIIYVNSDRSRSGVHGYRTGLFNAARKKGYACISIVDDSYGYPDMLPKESDLVVFTHGLSEDALHPAITQLSEEYHIKALFCFPGQVAWGANIGKTVETFCQKLGLPYMSALSLDNCNNKYMMRKALDSAGVPSIPSALIHSEQDLVEAALKIGFPIIFKPVIGAGSTFVRKCDTLEDLKGQYQKFRREHSEITYSVEFDAQAHSFTTADGVEHHYQPAQTALLEGYINGHEGSVECIVHDGKVYPMIVHDKFLITEEKYTILEHLLVTPAANFNAEQVNDAYDYAARCLTAMGLDRCVVHLEYRQTINGPIVIEINPRVGGFYIPKSFEYAAGINAYEINLDMLEGVADTAQIEQAQKKAHANQDIYAMFLLYPPRSGFVKGLKGLDHVDANPNILEYLWDNRPGYMDIENEEDFLAKFWGRADSFEDANMLYKQTMSDITVLMTDIRVA